MIKLKEIPWLILLIYPISMVMSLQKLPLIIIIITSILSSIFVLIALYLIISYEEIGLKNTIKFLIISYVVSYIFEFLGVRYGIPFGKYYYNPKGLGPLLFGVPLFIPFLWASLGFFSLAVSNWLLAVLGMVTLDIAFDPLLSYKAKLWVWITKGDYYGVPITNFIGWAIVSFIFYAIYKINKGKSPKKSVYSVSFYIEYLVSWIILDFIKGLWLAGLLGILMGFLFMYLSFFTGIDK
ncbi:putative membrane protein [Caldisphaera lagunensis DSM 15908]|uniref:Putative membrane protein n=1 Tax=Caldisphaera lagunensis (strain DSM 15908 / JCM 11604 / ANMR 0165 / IC-154) TaxID=1056495 RepID=L0ABI6_CALLD|nr:carotenoid biosynthesis protein [Caldisphaera lagunensis]AFZ71221.1 putative membrane protein [Caldisphaera lagunensis DSM 15908]